MQKTDVWVLEEQYEDCGCPKLTDLRLWISPKLVGLLEYPADPVADVKQHVDHRSLWKVSADARENTKSLRSLHSAAPESETA